MGPRPVASARNAEFVFVLDVNRLGYRGKLRPCSAESFRSIDGLTAVAYTQTVLLDPYALAKRS